MAISYNDIDRNIESVVIPVCQELADIVMATAPNTPAQAAVENFNGGFLIGAYYVLGVLKHEKLIEDEGNMFSMFVEGMEKVLEHHKACNR